MAAPRPMPVAPPGLLDEDGPSKWDQIKQILWESNLNAPIRGAYNLMNTPYDVLTGGPSPELDQAVADSFDAAGGVTVGSAMIPKPSNAMAMGIKAYHGSPHSFDKFSMDKIGTGEGAQAYGHGLYFAENEGVAKGYRDNLAGNRYDTGFANVDAALNGGAYQGAWDKFAADHPDLATQIKEAGRDKPVGSDGSMYEVSINADPNAFLDWDKPLSEQPEAVRKAIMATKGNLPPNAKDDLGGDYSLIYGNDIQPGQFLNTLEQIGGRPDFGENLLRDQGIPGIKYLDAGSRGAGDGTRNYVVFDDSLIDIIKKYGIAGLLGSGGLYGMSDDQAQAGAF